MNNANLVIVVMLHARQAGRRSGLIVSCWAKIRSRGLSYATLHLYRDLRNTEPCKEIQMILFSESHLKH
jgi:hypothetical protein